MSESRSHSPETSSGTSAPPSEATTVKETEVPESQNSDESQPESSKASSSEPALTVEGSSASTGPGAWQAIYSHPHNAYYFHNSITQETTWINPLQAEPSAQASDASVPPADPSASPQPESSTSETSGATSYTALQVAAAAQGIDPALAYLDPSLAGPSHAGAFTYTAKFNARTGAFTKADGRDPSHLSEYERAKRMSEFYFDVNGWEQEVEERKRKEAEELEYGDKKKKKLTKKDLERFKEQKKQKKLAKTAWLRT